MRTIDDMVRMEVHYCVSALVSTLASGSGHVSMRTRDFPHEQLIEQAVELCSPIQDFEEAAIQNGWLWDGNYWTLDQADDFTPKADTAEQAASIAGFEPYEREIFEHWIVSDWLAEKLAAEGERVDTDFAGLTVWGRTTTGQGIAQDGVIQRIYAATHK